MGARPLAFAVSVALLGAFVTLAVARGGMGAPEGAVPTTRVRRGNLSVKVYTTGELRPSRSALLLAPPVSGTLQIVSLLQTGTRVSAQDVVLEFDPAEQEYNVEQARSELAEVEEEIRKTQAEGAIQAAEDEVSLIRARFDVRRAELDVSGNELVSAIDARKNLLTQEEAKRRLAQLERDIPSRQASSQAGLQVLQEKRNKARLRMQQAQRAIDEMKLRAPMSGLVSVKENRGMFGGWAPPGLTFPEYREGDLVGAGTTVAEVLQVDQMEIQAKVDESDRANVGPGQPAEVRVDALPGEVLKGKVKGVAGAASRGFFFGGGGAKKFDAVVLLDKREDRLRPGLTVQLTIGGEELEDALILPRQVVFEKDGKPVVYVRSGSAFESREVKVKKRSDSLVAVEDLEEGVEVALVDPEERSGKPKKDGAPPAPAVGGPR
jgi:HlyD family secretion protein